MSFTLLEGISQNKTKVGLKATFLPRPSPRKGCQNKTKVGLKGQERYFKEVMRNGSE